jgi:hypothetical protein
MFAESGQQNYLLNPLLQTFFEHGRLDVRSRSVFRSMRETDA